MKEVCCGISRKPYVCGPFSLTERVVSSKKLLLDNCQASSSWYNKKSDQIYGSRRAPIFLSLQFFPPRGSDSLIIRLYIVPALLQHNLLTIAIKQFIM